MDGKPIIMPWAIPLPAVLFSVKESAMLSSSRTRGLVILVLMLAAMCPAGRSAAQDEFTVRGSAVIRFENESEKPLGKVQDVQGDVFLLHSGDALWQPGLIGMALLRGDQLRTGPRSGALVTLRDGTAVKLGPMSLLAFDETGQALQSGVAALEQGKLWASVARGGGLERFIVKAGGAVFDTEHGNMFVEVDKQNNACADVFTGSLNARSLSDPGAMALLDVSQRVQFQGGALGDPGAFSAVYNQTDDAYTCLSGVVQTEAGAGTTTGDSTLVFTVGDAGAEEITLVVIGSSMVTFNTGEQKTDDQTYTTTSGSLVFTAEDSVAQSTPDPDEIVEYEDIVIMSSAMVKFEAPEGACTTAPVIGSVSAAGQSAATGGSVAVVVDTCGAVTLALEGAVSATCGDVSSVTVTAGGDSLSVDLGDSSWSASFSPDTDDPAAVTVAARDSRGNQSEVFSFTVAVRREVEAPAMEIVSVAHLLAADITGVADVFRDNLEGGRFIIKGTAASENCSVKTVEVSLDNGGSWAAAQETGNWTYSFTPSDGTYNILARAKDELGTESAEMFQPLEVAYHSRSEEDNLRAVFEAMMQAYINRDTSSFAEYTSSSYSSNYDSIEDKNNLENSLDNKFAAFSTIALRYKIDEIIITGDEGRVSFSWDANAAGSGYAQYAAFSFAKEPEWKFTAVQDDNTFLRYTSIAQTVSISAAKSTLVADESDNTTVTVSVKDSAGNPIADGTEVSFTATTGDITPASTTMTGKATVVYTAGSATGAATVTAAVGAQSAVLSLTLQPEHAPLPPE
jgi:hypothetical protein